MHRKITEIFFRISHNLWHTLYGNKIYIIIALIQPYLMITQQVNYSSLTKKDKLNIKYTLQLSQI